MSQIFRPTYLHPELGEIVNVPVNGILDIGGTSGPFFTVNGKPLLFADGTSTDSGQSVDLNLDLQKVYNNSVDEAFIKFVQGKDLILEALNSNQFKFDAETGLVTITGNLTVLGTINSSPISFNAIDIKADTSTLEFLSGDNVQDVINSIDFALKNIQAGESTIRPYEHMQDNASDTWIIHHNKNSRRVQISVWDLENELLFSDIVKIIDNNTIVITFSTPAVGRAILMLF